MYPNNNTLRQDLTYYWEPFSPVVATPYAMAARMSQERIEKASRLAELDRQRKKSTKEKIDLIAHLKQSWRGWIQNLKHATAHLRNES